MRKMLLILVTVAIVAAVGAPILANGGDDGFGDNVAGVWFGRFGNTPFIQNYSADGTVLTTTTSAVTSNHHVTWEKTGPREITWRLLHFNYNDFGLTFVSRTTGVQEYDNKFTEFSGVFTIEFCPCENGPPPPGIDPNIEYACSAVLDALWDDPNDPSVCIVVPLGPFPMSAKRLNLDVPSSPW